MRRLLRMPGFNAVAAGQTATVDLPTSFTYHQLRLRYGTTTGGGPTRTNMEAEIDEVRLKVNGKVQRVFSATELFAINAYRGLTVDDGVVPILFSEPWRREALGEDLVAWGMADVDTFQIEVDIDAAATNPTLSGVMLVGDEQRTMDRIVKWRRFNIPVSAIGVVNVSTLPKIDAYSAIHAFSANINDVEVKVDQKEWFEDVDRAELVELARQAGFIAQTGVFPIDFSISTARISDMLALQGPAGPAKDFRIDFDMAAATSFDVITETFGLRD